MFDADTVALIAGAPALDGLDLEDLPQRLTNAYASIVASRVRMREIAQERILPDSVAAVIGEMRRLAFTYEAFVSALPERADRAAAAFVAGAAHHVCLLAEQVGLRAFKPSRLGLESISPEVSATLLFLISEASADAAEMAKSIVLQTDDPIEAALLSALVHCRLLPAHLRRPEAPAPRQPRPWRRSARYSSQDLVWNFPPKHAENLRCDAMFPCRARTRVRCTPKMAPQP